MLSLSFLMWKVPTQENCKPKQPCHDSSSCQAARGVRAIWPNRGRASGNSGSIPSSCFRLASFCKLPLTNQVLSCVSFVRVLPSFSFVVLTSKGEKVPNKQQGRFEALLLQPPKSCAYESWDLFPTSFAGFYPSRRPSSNRASCGT